MATNGKPERTRVYQSFLLDSPRWDRFETRADDIVISTSIKAGTTWTQMIVALLVFQTPKLPAPLHDLSPWIDMRILPFDDILAMLEAQKHRRFVKTHLPLDALPYNDQIRYIMIGRDPRDVALSLWNHMRNYKPEFIEMVNSMPGRVGGPHPTVSEDFREFWHDWATRSWFDWENDGYPYWSHLYHADSWWKHKGLDNILFVHYNDMLADLPGQMRRIADYLGIEVAESAWPELVEAATFKSMRDNYKNAAPAHDLAWKDAQKFFRAGTNGRWRELLSQDDLALYDRAAERALTPELRNWLENGGS